MSQAKGHVATSHPLAVSAGLRILDQGGSAADAAIASAAVLCVVDPRSTGIGGDLFALHWQPGDAEPTGIQGAGWSPEKLTPQYFADRGIEKMPTAGALSITVPGSVDGWVKLHERYGKLDFSTLLQPAIEAAYRGFLVEKVIAVEWKTAYEKLNSSPAGSVFLRDGNTPVYGDMMFNPEMGKVLEQIAADKGADFYRGETAQAVADAVQQAGGLLAVEDIQQWPGASWVEPVGTEYRGHQVYQMPPPGQGLVVLEALAILNQMSYQSPRQDVLAATAMGQAVVDGAKWIGDPQQSPVVATEKLLNPAYVKSVADRVSGGDISVDDGQNSGADTIYVTVVDGAGNACSLIQSVYQSFGSGVVVPGKGFALQNRGANFFLEEGHVNQVGPRKVPYHTIIPSLTLKDGDLFTSMGVVGGFMQPQGQVQILRRLIDDNQTAADAVEAPRWRWTSPGVVGVEAGYPESKIKLFEEAGYRVEILEVADAGGAQVLVNRNGHIEGGSDWRKDGLVGSL